MNWYAPNKIKNQPKMIVTKSNLEKFKHLTSKNQLTTIAKNTNILLRSKYTSWQKEADSIFKQCFKEKKFKKSKPQKIVRFLKRKRELKKKRKLKNNDKEKIRLLQLQLQLIDEFITEEEHRNNAMRLEMQIRKFEKEGGIKSNAFWKITNKKRKMKNEELPSAMINKQGKLETEKGKISEVFKEFYEDLFKKEEIETINSKEAKEIREITFNTVKNLAQIKENTSEEISKED